MPPQSDTQSPALEVRVAAGERDLAAIRRLRYDVFVAEMARPEDGIDHQAHEIRDGLDEAGFVLGAFDSAGRVHGTVRSNPVEHYSADDSEFFGWGESQRAAPGQVVMISRLVVAPTARGSSLVMRMIRQLYGATLAQGHRFAWLSANAHLVELYGRCGFVVRHRKIDRRYGEVALMKFDLHDLAHLRAIRSPLARQARSFLRGRNAAA